MTQGTPIRLLLVEDQPLVAEELLELLQAYTNIDIVGVARDGDEAIAKAAALQPSVIVMDVNLPRMDGIAATREIKKRYPNIVVIGVTVAPEDYVVYTMLRVGAFEVLPKENAAEDLYRTIQAGVASAYPILPMTDDVGSSKTGDSKEFPAFRQETFAIVDDMTDPEISG